MLAPDDRPSGRSPREKTGVMTVAPPEMRDRIDDLLHGDLIVCDFCGKLVPRSAAEMVNREEADPDRDIDEIWVWACHACRVAAELGNGLDSLEPVGEPPGPESAPR